MSTSRQICNEQPTSGPDLLERINATLRTSVIRDGVREALRNVKNFPGRAPADEGALRFICNADNHVRNEDGSPYCR